MTCLILPGENPFFWRIYGAEANSNSLVRSALHLPCPTFFVFMWRHPPSPSPLSSAVAATGPVRAMWTNAKQPKGLSSKNKHRKRKERKKKKVNLAIYFFFLFILIFFPFLFSIGLETLRDTRRSLRSGHFAAKFLIRKTTHH